MYIVYLFYVSNHTPSGYVICMFKRNGEFSKIVFFYPSHTNLECPAAKLYNQKRKKCFSSQMYNFFYLSSGAGTGAEPHFFGGSVSCFLKLLRLWLLGFQAASATKGP